MGNLLSIIDQGFIFSLVATAVYLTSRIIKKDDLTVEGSFGFGGALTAVMLYKSWSPWLTMLLSLILGASTGAFTGILITRLRMNHLMAGLVTSTACFSISLVLASANKVIPEQVTVFKKIAISNSHLSEIICLGLAALLFLLAIRFVLGSQIGLLLRAVGENPHLLIQIGKSSSFYYILGFALANALTAVAGSLFVQWSGFFSITGNIGTLVTGLASLMIAELVNKALGLSVIVAAIIYQSIFAVTLMVGIDPVFNNLVKALIMILLVAVSSTVKTHKGEQHA